MIVDRRGALVASAGRVLVLPSEVTGRMVERKTGLLPVEHLRIHSHPKEEHMLNEPTGWQVWTTVEGVADLDIEVATAADADEVSGAASLRYRDEGLAYEVFVLAHYCGGGEDCDCVQWLTDHQPRYSYHPRTGA
jgi:hypothetical protein